MTAKLSELLKDSEVAALTDIREDAATKARTAKAKYERNSVWFILSGGLATIAGALILLSTGGEGSKEVLEAAQRGEEVLTPETLASVQSYLSQPIIRSLLFVVEVFALAFAAYTAEILRSSKADVSWIANRREAEAGRIKIFNKIMEQAQKRDTAPSHEYEIAAFDHFLTEQLDKQIKHHKDNDQEASEGAWRTIRIGAAIAAVVGGVGATGTIGEWWIVFGAFVGVIAPVLMHGLTKYREMKLDRERSESSANTWKILREIRGRADAARSDLTAGNPDAARQMIVDTHATMKAENEAWTPTKSPI